MEESYMYMQSPLSLLLYGKKIVNNMQLREKFIIFPIRVQWSFVLSSEGS